MATNEKDEDLSPKAKFFGAQTLDPRDFDSMVRQTTLMQEDMRGSKALKKNSNSLELDKISASITPELKSSYDSKESCT